MSVNSPIAFVFFNKNDTTKQVFCKIKENKPKKLYLISDGGRDDNEKHVVKELRDWVESQIDWECNYEEIYADENMGCKNRIVSGISYVLNIEKSVIVIEDDCLPLDGFFEYMDNMLEMYKDNEQIYLVAGSNLVPASMFKVKDAYTFNADPWIWGWGTWRRVWEKYDPDIIDWPKFKNSKELYYGQVDKKYYYEEEERFDSVYAKKIDTWDYQLTFCVWKNRGLQIVPQYNLVENIGFGIDEATHTKTELPNFLRKVYCNKIKKDICRDYYVKDVMLDKKFIRKYSKVLYGGIVQRMINLLYKIKCRIFVHSK